ncbi:MAG TPA: UDP-N-acetylmuramoyl-L-alanyl-D-glutamate--2,6-diaminopimelate ligase [Alphaproteobacteria bacterium]|nr:UDP-N-acetylmuramoyl-L-alanyl-D-glutamate--2,6-diaminopimelate ligase [Alphaproteobacteria bacterium]HAJ48400.1 UDP-N-acetylmuramoyl-L-alanyl-D-glutamate--2,6-diaminopimelate ligase [Alphaproteobacteria bacterium]
MKLRALTHTPLASDPEISGLSSDSRTVRHGDLFAALAGVKADGAAFLPQAFAKGAAAALVSYAHRGAVPEGACVIADANPRSRLAQIAGRFFAHAPAFIAAVTGTNGKTSVANFLRQIWAHAGLKAASMGTVGAITPNGVLPLQHTTPDPIVLHQMMQTLSNQGISHVALEASSHGLDQSRLDGLEIAVAGFTNLTRDHLDYHATIEAYRAAKARLFAEVLAPGRTAVINNDSPEAQALLALCRARGQNVLTVGEARGSALRLAQRQPEGLGQRLRLSWAGRDYDLLLPLAGGFQSSNVLVAAGMALASGTHPDGVFESLGSLKGAPGRLERVAVHPNGAAIYVDYAHTPDAIETAIAALRPHTSGRLWIVFGCGGDRDPGKRPLMGAAASAADEVIVTDDNPRSEDPSTIRKAALAGVTRPARDIGDRAQAIREAVAHLAAGDILIIAGKGHETGQTMGGQTRHFDDSEEARAAVAELGGQT